MENCWIFNGKCLYDAPEGYYGYIYHIIDRENRHYWGKKAFEHNKKIKLSKKKRVGTRKRIERTKVDSGWLDYWGSSKFLQEYFEKENPDKESCYREIIKLCKNKESLSYWEVATLIENQVLFRDDCYNGNIGGRYFRGKVHK